jgi:hypothetical protein
VINDWLIKNWGWSSIGEWVKLYARLWWFHHKFCGTRFTHNLIKDYHISHFSGIWQKRAGAYSWLSFLKFFFQILRLFSESAESITALKIDLAEAKKRLGNRNKQLHQLWYRSVTLRHIISLLDQIEGIAKVGLNLPADFVNDLHNERICSTTTLQFISITVFMAELFPCHIYWCSGTNLYCCFFLA